MTNCPNSLSPVERVRAMEELYDLLGRIDTQGFSEYN